MRALAIRALGVGVGVSIAVAAAGADAHVVVHQYSAPNAAGAVAMSGTGDDGIWIAQPQGNSLARVNPDGTLSEVPLPTSGSRPLALARGTWADRLVFTEVDANRIGLVDPSGHFTEYDIPTPASSPRGIAVGFSSTLWFTEYDGSRIGRLNLVTGAIQEFPLPAFNAGPLGMAIGPGPTFGSNEIWFTEYLANKVGRIDDNGAITEYAIPTANSGPGAIVEGVVDNEGMMFFTESTANKIARIRVSGHVTEYVIPTPASSPADLVHDWAYGGVWFSERAGGKIGWISPEGDIREFPLPAGTRPEGIALDYPDDYYEPPSIWYVDGSRRRVGRLSGNVLFALGAVFSDARDTVFAVSNTERSPAHLRLGRPYTGICPPLVCPSTSLSFDVPPEDSVQVAVSDVPQSQGDFLFSLDASRPEINDVPDTSAWIIDSARPGARIDLPLVDYWTIAAMQPPLASGTNGPRPFLTFPARRNAGVRTDLLLAAIDTEGRESLEVLLEALDPQGVVVADMTLELPELQIVVLDKILSDLGIFQNFDGHLRVKRVSRSGLFWGVAELVEGGVLTRVLAPGSELQPPRCVSDEPHCIRPRQPRVVSRP